MSRDEAISSLTPRKQQIVAAANTLVAHKINGWGKITIQHGPVVDFNADYGKNGKYGFNYWGGWSTSLIQANQLTGDAKYLDAFEELFNQWYEQRNHIHGEIPELDVVYYELGLGLRCRPFLQFYCSAKPQAATHEHMLKAMLGNATGCTKKKNANIAAATGRSWGALAWLGSGQCCRSFLMPTSGCGWDPNGSRSTSTPTFSRMVVIPSACPAATCWLRIAILGTWRHC